MIAMAGVLDLPNESSSNEEVEVARRFYCECLKGRQLTPATRADGILFVVDGVLVETGTTRRSETARVVVPVDDPADVAARCWDAGYTVLMDDAAGVFAGAAIAILDPFGLRIELERADDRARSA